MKRVMKQTFASLHFITNKMCLDSGHYKTRTMKSVDKTKVSSLNATELPSPKSAPKDTHTHTKTQTWFSILSLLGTSYGKALLLVGDVWKIPPLPSKSGEHGQWDAHRGGLGVKGRGYATSLGLSAQGDPISCPQGRKHGRSPTML